jgi:Flp pilus assembly protein TadD
MAEYGDEPARSRPELQETGLRIRPLIAATCLSLFVVCGAGAKAVPAVDISSDDSTGLGNYLSARFAAMNHDLDEAAHLYMDSLERDPQNPQLQAYAFMYSAISGHVDDAAKVAEQLVTTEPDQREARLTLAVWAIKHHDFKKARDELSKAAKGPFTSFTVALLDGWAAAGAGDRTAAAADFKSLHALRSADALAYFNEAMLAEMFGDNQTADTYYKQARDIAGPTPRVIDAYGRFLERNGRAAEARELYQKLVADDAFEAIAGPGLKRIEKGEKPEPLAPTAEDGAAEALFGIASSLSDENSRDISILYVRLALYLEPKLDLGTILLANRWEALGKYDDAIAAYRTIDSDSPFHHLVSVAIAVDMARLNKTDDAIAALEKLAAEDPSDIETWTALGDSYREVKKFPQAVNAYNKAIAVAQPPTKKHWPLFYARAIAEQESGNWPAAEADLKQALVLSPNEPAVLNYLGYSWVDQKRNISQALGMLEKARALSPQDGYIIDSVGWAYYRLGRYDDAARTLEEAIQLVPGDPTINDHLGDAYWKVGRKLDAEFQWSHALAFGAEDGDKAKIEKKLQMVEQ